MSRQMPRHPSIPQTFHYNTLLQLRIALRYLLSRKSHNAVNILSLVAVAGVAVAAAAMVIVLSVFNGFTDIAASKLSILDPDILVVPRQGKVIENYDSVAGVIARTRGIELVAPVVMDNALAASGDMQVPVKVMGLTDEALELSGMQGIMLDGVPYFGAAGSDRPGAILSVGAAVATGLRADPMAEINLYVPRRKGRMNPARPMAAFRADTLGVAGVYRVEQAEYDTDLVIIPLETARHLLEYDSSQATSIRIYTACDAAAVVNELQCSLGDQYRVLDRHAQQQQAFNMIAVEKWVTLMMLVCILIITSFNIISTIYILRLEKRGNMAVLKAMGATDRFVRRIFTLQGMLITLAGGFLGLVIGTVVTLIQQWGGVIKLQAGDPSVLAVESYPVRLEVTDLLVVAGIIIVISTLCSQVATYQRKK